MRSWWMRGVLAAGLALGAAACGTSVNEGSGGSGGGAGGAGGGTTGSGGEGGAIPPECAVETSDPGPYTVTFQFENSGVGTAYLREDCHLNYAIRSCADGFAEPLAIHADCSQACGETGGGCLVCGACELTSVPVAENAQATDSWSGLRYTFGMTSEGCSCHEQHLARPGRYRIEVPVYTSDLAAQEGTPSYEVSVNFELPAPNGVVVVPIGQSP